MFVNEDDVGATEVLIRAVSNGLTEVRARSASDPKMKLPFEGSPSASSITSVTTAARHATRHFQPWRG